jgi:hypothetical protein
MINDILFSDLSFITTQHYTYLFLGGGGMKYNNDIRNLDMSVNLKNFDGKGDTCKQ